MLQLISLSVFLYRKKKEDPSAIILIYFLLSVGVCYLSASTSARGDLIGRISLIVTLPGSIVLFIHFFKSYFSRYIWYLSNTNPWLYYIPFIVFIY